MTIEKNNKVYEVTETERVWTLSTKVGGVFVKFNVSKSDCPTLEDLKTFVIENSVF